MEKHKSKFGQDFSDNKKALDQVTIIRSKGLKNEIAGYITKYIKHEIHDNEIRHAQEELAAEQASENAPVNTEEAHIQEQIKASTLDQTAETQFTEPATDMPTTEQTLPDETPATEQTVTEDAPSVEQTPDESQPQTTE